MPRRRRRFIARANRRTKHGVFPPGFFLKGDPRAIAVGIKARSPSYRVAMARLTFYINRGGRTLSAARRAVLERAKHHLRGLYGVSMHRDRARHVFLHP
jgi:hypothetical protein